MSLQARHPARCLGIHCPPQGSIVVFDRYHDFIEVTLFGNERALLTTKLIGVLLS